MSKKNFWKNKKVLITGHTGFKGSWLTLILHSLGAKIIGYALDPISKPNFFDDLNLGKFLKKDIRSDISDLKKLKKVLNSFKPSIIFHLVGQSSVFVSYKDPLDTVNANVNGTVNLLESARSCKSIKSIVLLTTDKVYLNLEEKKKFKETDKLGGYDLYSSSKAAGDILAASYIKSFYKNSKCNIGIARAGNCIGGGDWTKDRIVKDCVEAFVHNKNLLIRSPNATRPWQHVMEPICGYLKLAEKLSGKNGQKFLGSWNFGPNNINLSVLNLAKLGKKIFNSKSKIIINKNKKNIKHEAKYLSLNSKKSLRYLNWKVYMKPELSLKLTFNWFKVFYQNKKNKKKNYQSNKRAIQKF